MKTELEKKGLDNNFKKIMFYLGIITGAITPLFWILQITFYLIYEREKPFFGKQFYNITYKWGFMIIALIIFTIIITLIL